MMDEITELCNDLCDITMRQAQIIDRLFILLMQHIDVDEISREVSEMRKVGEIRSKWEK